MASVRIMEDIKATPVSALVYFVAVNFDEHESIARGMKIQLQNEAAR
jgi:hypothetical protein